MVGVKFLLGVSNIDGENNVVFLQLERVQQCAAIEHGLVSIHPGLNLGILDVGEGSSIAHNNRLRVVEADSEVREVLGIRESADQLLRRFFVSLLEG